MSSTITLWHPIDITEATLNTPQPCEIVPHDLPGKLSWKRVKELLDGGFVEVVNIDRSTNVIMLVDEDGRSKHLVFNPMGTALYERMSIMNGHGPANFAIVGKILVGPRKEFEL